jgi:Uncharacterised nucleotidyltransferase
MQPIDFVLDTLSHFVRKVDGPPPGIPARTRPDFEQELTWLCEWHGLTPIVLASLDRLALHPQISRIALERIRALAGAASTLSAELLITSEALVTRLRSDGIDCLPIDDVLLAGTAYELGLRPVQKIDILIREGQWTAALACCRDEGFELTPGSPRFTDGTEALDYHQHYPACTLQNKSGDPLRLHMRVLDVGKPGAIEPAWNRAAEDPATGAGQVSAEDQLVRSCIHFVMTDFARLLYAVDIGLFLCRTATSLDWDYIEDRLHAKTVYAPVLLTLESTARWMRLDPRRIGLPIPGRVRRRLFHTMWHVNTESFVERRPHEFHKLRFTLLAVGRWKDKVRFLGALFSPRREWVAAFFDRPYHPWLRIRFVVLVLKGRVGLHPSGNP